MSSRAANHRLDEPTKLSSAWLHPCSARFRFTCVFHHQRAADDGRGVEVALKKIGKRAAGLMEPRR